MPDAQIIQFDGAAASARAQKAARTRSAEPAPIPDEDVTGEPTQAAAEAQPAVAVGIGDAESAPTEVDPKPATAEATKPRRPRASTPKADGAKVRPAARRNGSAKSRSVAEPAGTAAKPPRPRRNAGSSGPNGVVDAPARSRSAQSKTAGPAPTKSAPTKSAPTKRASAKAVKPRKEPAAAPMPDEAVPPAQIDTPIVSPPSTPAAAAGKPQADAAAATSAPAERAGTEDAWDRRVAGALAFLRRRLTGEYETDEFGFDPEFATSVLAPALRPIYRKWFRVEMSGLEHLAGDRGALLVANHSGTIPVDATMLQLGILDQHPAHRHLRLLAADLVFQMPFVGELARKSGSTLACQPDAERLLSGGELVGVFPEGFKGVGKPFSERYKLQRFGRGGFVSAALATSAPIIPCAIVGAEEIYPKIGDAKTIARMFGLPYFPLTPTFPWLGPLGAVPLPSKWYIEIGEPIETTGLASGADDPMQVFNLTDQVRETIQQMLYRLLMRRRSVFG